MRQFKTNRLTGGGEPGLFLNETPGNKKENSACQYKSIVTANSGGYLDQMLLAPKIVKKNYGNLNLKFRKDNRIILKKGEVIVPFSLAVY